MHKRMLEFVKSSHKKSDSKKKKKNIIQQQKENPSNRGRNNNCSEIETTRSTTSITNAGKSDGPGF